MGHLYCNEPHGICLYAHGSVSAEHCGDCPHLGKYEGKALFPDAKYAADLEFMPGVSVFDTDVPKGIAPIEKADRFNEGKPKWSLVHYQSLVPMIRVLEYGCLKYAPFNWQKPMDTMEILESMQRHLAALFDGETIDTESGISHMGHIQCNAMFYNYHKAKENEVQS